MKVLQSLNQAKTARAELDRRGLSYLTFDSWPLRTLHERGLLKGIRIGDRVKSWDVLETVRFIETHVARNKRILDIGAYASEMLCILHRLGYSDLTGLDLNAGLARMPFPGAIRWKVGNFLSSPFPDESFDVITAISVIEHGYDGASLFTEIARLLRPGGSLIASFDYWPEKIDTSDTKFFGMDWKIFSEEEVDSLIHLAGGHGLAPVEVGAESVSQKPISTSGRSYTFAWIVLSKGQTATTD